MIKPKKPTVEQRLASIEKWITWRMRCAIAVEERIRDLTTAFHEHMDEHAAPAVEKKVKRDEVRDIGNHWIIYDTLKEGPVADVFREGMAREYCAWLNSNKMWKKKKGKK